MELTTKLSKIIFGDDKTLYTNCDTYVYAFVCMCIHIKYVCVHILYMFKLKITVHLNDIYFTQIIPH